MILKKNSFIKIFLSISLVIFTLFYKQFFNDFTFLLGDKTGYDNTIHTSILEHWFNFFKGKTSWSEVGYFYPYTRTIAQTDGYFLTGVLYSNFRLFINNPYIATEFVLIVLKVIGFLGAYFLARLVLKFNTNYALLIAILFSLNNAMTSHGYRVQLATVAFAPWLFLIHYETLKSFIAQKKATFFIFGSISMIFFGLWCLTCFYMAWFYAFFISVFLIIFLLFLRPRIKVFVKRLINLFIPLIGIIVITLISIAPFVYAYYPKSLETGTRIYENISFTTLTVENLFQLGNSNYFYTPIYNSIIELISPNYVVDSWEYYNMGINFVIFVLSILFTIFILFGVKNKSPQDKILFSIGLSTILCIFFILKIDDKSLWEIIFKFIPGAKALGVINIFMILLALPLYILSVAFLKRITLSKLILYPLILFLILSELNSPLLQLDRRVQSKLNLNYPSPPTECNSFFVTGWKDQEKFYGIWEWINNQYAHNTSAMMISQFANVPTLNGMASFIPRDYDLVGPNGTAFSPNSQEYFQKIEQYIKRKNLKNVCQLDLNNKKWTNWN